MQSLRCQSQLQSFELKGRMLSTCMGMQPWQQPCKRAFCSEVKLEEIGLSCLVFGMDVPCGKVELGLASQLNLKCCFCHPSTEVLGSSSFIKHGRAKDQGCAACDGEAWGPRATITLFCHPLT